MAGGEKLIIFGSLSVMTLGLMIFPIWVSFQALLPYLTFAYLKTLFSGAQTQAHGALVFSLYTPPKDKHLFTIIGFLFMSLIFAIMGIFVVDGSDPMILRSVMLGFSAFSMVIALFHLKEGFLGHAFRTEFFEHGLMFNGVAIPLTEVQHLKIRSAWIEKNNQFQLQVHLKNKLRCSTSIENENVPEALSAIQKYCAAHNISLSNNKRQFTKKEAEEEKRIMSAMSDTTRAHSQILKLLIFSKASISMAIFLLATLLIFSSILDVFYFYDAQAASRWANANLGLPLFLIYACAIGFSFYLQKHSEKRTWSRNFLWIEWGLIHPLIFTIIVIANGSIAAFINTFGAAEEFRIVNAQTCKVVKKLRNESQKRGATTTLTLVSPGGLFINIKSSQVDTSQYVMHQEYPCAVKKGRLGFGFQRR